MSSLTYNEIFKSTGLGVYYFIARWWVGMLVVMKQTL